MKRTWINFFTNIKLNDNSQYTEPVLAETVLTNIISSIVRPRLLRLMTVCPVQVAIDIGIFREVIHIKLMS